MLGLAGKLYIMRNTALNYEYVGKKACITTPLNINKDTAKIFLCQRSWLRREGGGLEGAGVTMVMDERGPVGTFIQITNIGKIHSTTEEKDSTFV